MLNSEVVVVGGPSTGKTHYGGQLFGRLRDRPGALRLAEDPGDITAFEEILQSLESGRAGKHTASATQVELLLRVRDDSWRDVDIRWPDYGGEQLLDLVQKREVSDRWRTRVRDSRFWMLFIRPETLRLYEDAQHRPALGQPSPVERQLPKGWDDNAHWVETLQVLLFLAGRSLHSPLETPRLAVMLSCWDERNPQHTPEEELFERLPLLSTFIRSNWQSDAFSVWGLSSLGRSLDRTKVDPEFRQLGPEQFGWVIHPGRNTRDEDLTAPLAWLLGLS